MPCTASRCWSGDAPDVVRIAASAASLALAAFLLLSAGCAGVAQPPQFMPRDENPEDYPAGAGRDDTFYACTACHGFKLVAQQGMTRRQWEDSLQWMVDKHGMLAAAGEGSEDRARLSRSDLPAARARGPRRLAESVRPALNAPSRNSSTGGLPAPPALGVSLSMGRQQ